MTNSWTGFVLYLFPLAFLASIVLWMRRREREHLVNLGLGLANYGSMFLLRQVVSAPILALTIWTLQFHRVPWPKGAYLWIVAFLLADLAYYWSHRLSHQVDLLWRTHALHHDPTEMGHHVHFRHSIWSVLYIFTFNLAISLVTTIGFWHLGICTAMIGFYQYFMHARDLKWPGKLGWLLVLPQTHRIHHQLGQQNRNFGGVFSIWDRLWGSHRTLPDETDYGNPKDDRRPVPWAWVWPFSNRGKESRSVGS